MKNEVTMHRSYPIPPNWLGDRVTIHLVGAGGTGSQVADQLASMQTTLMLLGHPGFSVQVFDYDAVSPSNVGRQRFTASDIGLAKSTVLVHRINLFYGLNWTAMTSAYSPGCHSPHLLITCVDKAKFRADVGARMKGSGLWIDFGNGATDAQVIIGRFRPTTYEPTREAWDVLPNVYDLYPDLASMSVADNEQPSCSAEEAIQRQAWPTNRAVAIAGMEILWNLFRHGKITHHGAFLTGNPLTVSPLAVDPATWSFLGYELPAYARPKSVAKRSRSKKAA